MCADEPWNFPVEVLNHFGWLVVEGFDVQLKESTRVVFGNENANVTVYQGRSSREIGVEVQVGKSGAAYAMSELLRLVDADDATAYRNPIALTLGELRRALEQQSERLRRVGPRCLHGDRSTVEELALNRKNWGEAYELETRLSSAVPKADKAFREGNYRGVVALLEPLEQGLSPALRKKLEFAKKKV